MHLLLLKEHGLVRQLVLSHNVAMAVRTGLVRNMLITDACYTNIVHI